MKKVKIWFACVVKSKFQNVLSKSFEERTKWKSLLMLFLTYKLTISKPDLSLFSFLCRLNVVSREMAKGKWVQGIDRGFASYSRSYTMSFLFLWKSILEIFKRASAMKLYGFLLVYTCVWNSSYAHILLVPWLSLCIYVYLYWLCVISFHVK